jgi:hypothetical protein
MITFGKPPGGGISCLTAFLIDIVFGPLPLFLWCQIYPVTKCNSDANYQRILAFAAVSSFIVRKMMEGVEQSQARTSDFAQLQKEYRLMEMNRKVSKLCFLFFSEL